MQDWGWILSKRVHDASIESLHTRVNMLIFPTFNEARLAFGHHPNDYCGIYLKKGLLHLIRIFVVPFQDTEFQNMPFFVWLFFFFWETGTIDEQISKHIYSCRVERSLSQSFPKDNEFQVEGSNNRKQNPVSKKMTCKSMLNLIAYFPKVRGKDIPRIHVESNVVNNNW